MNKESAGLIEAGLIYSISPLGCDGHAICSIRNRAYEALLAVSGSIMKDEKGGEFSPVILTKLTPHFTDKSNPDLPPSSTTLSTCKAPVTLADELIINILPNQMHY